MTKKKLKRPGTKLALNKKTLRTLSESELDSVSGGFTTKRSIYNCNLEYASYDSYGGGYDSYGGGGGWGGGGDWGGGWY